MACKTLGLGVLLLGSLSLVGCRAASKVVGDVRPSGVSTNGKELSENEAKEGLKEILAMSRGAKAGDPTTLNTSVEPKTEMGKNFKRLAIKSAGVEKTFAQALGDKTIGGLLTPEALSSASARKEAKADLAKIRAAAKTYYRDTRGVSEELFTVISGANGQKLGEAKTIGDQVAASEKAMMGLLDKGDEIFAFADRTKPKLQGGQLMFRKSADIGEFNRLTSGFNRASSDFERATADALRDRQRKMSEAMSKASTL